MPPLLTLIAANTTTTVAKSKGSGSQAYTLIFLVVIVAAAYFLFLRPRQQRQRQRTTQARQLGVGDEVVSIGGIMGTIVAIDDQEVEVEVSPGVVMTFVRRAINPRPGTTPSGGTVDPDDDDDDDYDEADEEHDLRETGDGRREEHHEAAEDEKATGRDAGDPPSEPGRH
jgi:preprotein translocase subunit YajC